jgi:hypothetical protein
MLLNALKTAWVQPSSISPSEAITCCCKVNSVVFKAFVTERNLNPERNCEINIFENTHFFSLQIFERPVYPVIPKTRLSMMVQTEITISPGISGLLNAAANGWLVFHT